MHSVLQQATISTFEEFAFLFSSGEPDELQRELPLDIAATVAFDGDLHGTLELQLSSGLLASVTANMMGEQEASDPQMQRDALGELTNVICGNVLPTIAGRRAVINLAAPRLTAPTDGVGATATSEVGIEMGRARAVLTLASAA